MFLTYIILVFRLGHIIIHIGLQSAPLIGPTIPGIQSYLSRLRLSVSNILRSCNLHVRGFAALRLIQTHVNRITGMTLFAIRPYLLYLCIFILCKIKRNSKVGLVKTSFHIVNFNLIFFIWLKLIVR